MNELIKELERYGLKKIRWSDDIVIYKIVIVCEGLMLTYLINLGEGRVSLYVRKDGVGDYFELQEYFR
jgi:hypothetical protein